MTVHRLARKQFHQIRRNVGAGEIDRRHVQYAAHADGQVGFAHVGFFHDQLDEARALFFLLFEQLLHLVRAQ